jgi:hypothetical protein
LEVVFILLEFPSPLIRIFIGSHSLLPPLWFAVSILQRPPQSLHVSSSYHHSPNPSRRQGTTAAAQKLLCPRRRPGTYDGGYDELFQLPNATVTATNVVADNSRRI